MECKKINSYLLITVITFLIITTLVLIKTLLEDSEGLEWGSVTDWISALCNVAMAGAALYAASQAKKWFKNKKFEHGYLSAKDLFLTLFKMGPVLDNIHTHVVFFRATSDASKDITEIEKILSEFYNLIADLNKSIFELQGVDWKFKDKYSEIYTLPARVEIESIILAARVSEVIYLDARENSDYYDPDYVKNQAEQLEHDIKELLTQVNNYKEIIDSILNERLQYELYFDIKTK